MNRPIDIDAALEQVRQNTRRRAERRWEEVTRKLHADGREDRRTLGIREPNPFEVFAEIGRKLGEAFRPIVMPRGTEERVILDRPRKNGKSPAAAAEQLAERRQWLLAERARIEHQDALTAVLAAWNDPGTHPHYHRQQQARLRRSWPILGRALDQLTDAHTGRRTSTSRH